MDTSKAYISGMVVILVIVGVVAAVLSFGSDGGGSDQAGNGSGDTTITNAPYTDYSGKAASLEQFDGKVLVVNAWASWCPFCVNEIPDFVELQEEFGDEIVVIAINRRESLEVAKGFTDSLGISDAIEFWLDPKDTFYKEIGGFSMPETLFIDREGNTVVHKRGFMALEEMRTHTQAALDNAGN